jgi:hypothetical protein
MPGRVAAARFFLSNQESGSPSLRPALHPVWLVPYPPNAAPQVKTHIGTLKHTPKGPRRKAGPNSCEKVPAPTPCAAVTSPPTLLSTNEPAANSNHPPGDPVSLCWPRPITHTPLTTSFDLHTPATHLLY